MRFLAALLLLTISCSKPNGDSGWGSEQNSEFRSSVSELTAIARQNRLLEVELQVAEDDTFYAVVDLARRRIGLRMQGVSLKDWEILGVAVHPAAEVDSWVGTPLTIVEKEVTVDRRSDGREEHWQEVTTSDPSGTNGNGGQDSSGQSESPAKADSSSRGYDPDRGLPTSYDLYTNRDLLISIRTQADMSRTGTRLDEWFSSITQAVREAILSLAGGSGSGRVQIILNGADCQSIFRSVQVGMRVILLP